MFMRDKLPAALEVITGTRSEKGKEKEAPSTFPLCASQTSSTRTEYATELGIQSFFGIGDRP
jgi:hypothetical protein